MIGGTDENEPEDRPPARTTTTPPPIAPPSPPLHGAGLGTRLFGSIRALLPARSPAAAPKLGLGLGLLLHLRSDHPLLHPIPSPSASASEEDPLGLEEDAAAAAAAAGLHVTADGRYGLGDGAATSAPANTAFSRRALHLPEPAAGAGGELEEEKLVGDKEKVVEQRGRGAAHRQGAVVKDVDAIHSKDGTTCCDIASADDQEKLGSTHNAAAVEDQEVLVPGVIVRTGECTGSTAAQDQDKAVKQCDTRELGTTLKDEDDQEAVEQGVIHKEGSSMNAVKNHQVVEQIVMPGMHATLHDTAVQDQQKGVDATYDLGAIENGDAAEDQEVVEQGVVGKEGLTMDSGSIGDQAVAEHGIVNKGGLTMDNRSVKDHKVVEQSISGGISANMDGISVEGQARVLHSVNEHNKVDNQGVIDGNGRPKDNIDVEEHDYLKEQTIDGNWGAFSDSTYSEDQKNKAGLYNGDEQIARKDMYAVHVKRSFLDQRAGDKQAAKKSDFTLQKHKDAVWRVCTERSAPDDDLGMDKAASLSIREISSSEVVSSTANGSDVGIGKKEKLKAKSDGTRCPSEQGNHGVAEILELNSIGLPLREGARSCTYYMRNGACRYGNHCHFNHPEHVVDSQFYAPTESEDSALQLEKSSDHHTTVDDTSNLKKSSDDATLDDTSYPEKSSDHPTLDDTSSSTWVLPPNILRMLLPPQKVPSSTEAKVIPAKKDSNWSSTSDNSDGCCSADSSDGPLCKQVHVGSTDGPLCKQEHVDYPERPGRPECPFYMRFGDCKFASACKYHHSKDKYPTRDNLEVPSLGGEQTEYPERPGEPDCPFYMKNRFCKYEAQCRFNHPKNSNPTAQSPRNAKIYVATNGHRQSARITLEDYMPQQQQYPERPGQPDCQYYLQFGKCKFLSACIFHHPGDGLPVGRNPSGPAHSDQIGPAIHDMPDCPFYMKRGKCQFGSACEFRHPKDIGSTTEVAMYPQRPGEPECLHYMNHGFCMFKMKCKYHHPADQLSRKQVCIRHEVQYYILFTGRMLSLQALFSFQMLQLTQAGMKGGQGSDMSD
ncbi:hypothetical protein QYE76_022247 [Lolium multiflorum]|uniref:C3H1-type domain-containing protein n=1 Tax=Lolium multiflorum TaxID=4521 RepID=A0AAD8VTL5_LOLMU|nr:hypothetical protein QYE76_022247 [Lolium multiflorum]